MAEMNMRVKVDKNVFHLVTLKDNKTYYLCAFYIQNLSSIQPFSIDLGFKEKSSKFFIDTFELCICSHPGDMQIEIKSEFHISQWDISISTPSGKVPLRKHDFTLPPRNCASIKGEDFKKLKKHPEILIICRMIYNKCDETTSNNTSAINSEYLNALKADLEKCSGASSREKVCLRVGEETEIVNKAVLCLRSPVFAKMFENDMREQREKTVTITDIKMPVVRALVSFLYSGHVPDCNFDFLCALYYAADKYEIEELEMACFKLLVSKVSLENLIQLLKLSLTHNDEPLKIAAMMLISINMQMVVSTSDWKNLMHFNPEVALEASTFFDLPLEESLLGGFSS